MLGQVRMPLDLSLAILVVDDEDTVRGLITAILQGLGFTELAQAADGAAALVLLRSRPFDLVISDLMMEPMSGLQLLRTVRADPELRPIKFMMMTASLTSDGAIAAKRAGVDTYLIKPFTPRMLGARIEEVCGQAAAAAGR